MLEPRGIEVDCEDCHKTTGGTAPLPDHAAYDPALHGGKIHCSSCHAQTVLACYNCHFESQVETHIKRHKQPIHGFVILANREKDGKVYPMSFQSLTNAGDAFVAFGPYGAHTIDSTGRTCSDCHNKANVQAYNSSGEMRFATWNENDSTLSYMKDVVWMPADYERSWRMDFLTYNGSTSNPMSAADKDWSKIGKDTWMAIRCSLPHP
jgi:hypothetical protein